MEDTNQTPDETIHMDIEELKKIFLEDDDGLEDFEDEVDTESEDAIEFREENSETEEDDDEFGDDAIKEPENYGFCGKDGKTIWGKNPPSRRKPSRSHNLLRTLPGVIGAAITAGSPVECWSCLFSDDILHDIVTYTNQNVENIKASFQRERDAKPIDIVELKAFIGLLILAGVHRMNRLSLEDLFGTEGDGIEKFRLVMSIKRFKFIMRLLRFDDRDTREQRRKVDKLAPIRDVFERFLENCKNSYSLSENVCVDEKLEGYQGKCSFRQYISSKTSKCGIKMYALVDCRVFYVLNLEIYVGLQPEGVYRVSNRPSDVVLRLCRPLYGSGRNVTADNWFTSIELVEELRIKDLSYVGTIRKNELEIPKEFTVSAGREIYSSLFGFRKNVMLASYIPEKGKCVVVASSLHEEKEIDPDSGDLKQPSVLTFYNSTKGGVDTIDKLCASYNVARNVRRWPMVIFFSLINISGINAQIIYVGNNQDVVKRKVFLKQLSHELVLPQIIRRSTKTSGMHRSLQESLQHFRVEEKAEIQDDGGAAGTNKRKRCQTCTAKRRLTRFKCAKCENPICLMHSINFCNICASDALNS